MTTRPPAAVAALAAGLSRLDWVRDVWVAGSLATGDHVPGVSDLDLVAVVDGTPGPARLAALVALHRELDDGPARGAALGCAYVAEECLLDVDARHPTWTHGRLGRRPLSAVTRAELVRHGLVVVGRSPAALLPAVTADDIRRAAQAELAGYWAWSVRRPWLWLDPRLAELALTSMARARHAMAVGELLTKTTAIETAAAPPRLVERMRTRRGGGSVALPRLVVAWYAHRDVRRTLRLARGRS